MVILHAANIPEIPGEVLAVITPHAGHIYSGRVAGHAFAAIRNLKPEVVVVVSPLHSGLRGSIFTSGHTAYQTPLGEIPVDLDLLNKFQINLAVQDLPECISLTFDREHSLEIELPFLQRIYPQPFRLLPIMVRDQSPDFMQKAGAALHQALQGKSCVVVASTDLSHFYEKADAERLDKQMMQAMQALSP